MTDQKGKVELEMTVKGLDLMEEGFLPKYRRVLQFMRVFTDPTNAKVEDIDAAEDFLVEHIVEPKDEKIKRNLISRLSANQVIDLFSRIGGQDVAVPPQKPVASGNSSESHGEDQNLQLGRQSSIA